jgi:hypothetical protein
MEYFIFLSDEERWILWGGPTGKKASVLYEFVDDPMRSKTGQVPSRFKLPSGEWSKSGGTGKCFARLWHGKNVSLASNQ